jgi:glycosyltransferase involved in cell wall biosynthesis
MRRFLVPRERGTGPGGAAGSPTFSIIVAAYESAGVIQDALRSAFSQTVPPLELIVCDDGSTDELENALVPYRDRITFLRNEHGGEASAKNTAARAARGDFVAILDADDVFLPQRLEALGELADARPDLDILTTDAYLEVAGRRLRRCYAGGWRFETEDQRRGILERNFVFGLAAVRRELLLAHDGFDESILWTTDWECWIRLVLAGARIGCVDEPLALYRLREASLSAQREQLTRGKILTLRKTRDDPRLTHDDHKVIDRAIAGYERELALGEARQAALRAENNTRRRSVALAFGHGYPWRARLEAGAMALAPRTVRRRLQRQEERTWVGAGGIRVERRPER